MPCAGVKSSFARSYETASDAIVTADSSGRIILWNKGAEDMFGYTAQEILNQSFATHRNRGKTGNPPSTF